MTAGPAAAGTMSINTDIEPASYSAHGAATSEAPPASLPRIGSTDSLCEDVAALSLLEEVAGGGGQAALQALKEAISSSKEASHAAVQEVLTALDPSTPTRRKVVGCRMVRAICLADGMPELQEAGVHDLLVGLLCNPNTDALLVAPAAEALISCAVRSRCVGSALHATPADNVAVLVQRLKPSSSPAQPAAPSQQSDLQYPQEPDGVGAATAVHSVLRLITSLAAHTQAMPVLLSAGLLDSLLDAATLQSNQGPASSSSSSPTSSPPPGPTAPTALSPSDSTPPRPLPLSQQPGWAAVQNSALGFLLKLSQYPQLHSQIHAAGAGHKLIALLNLSTPVAAAEPAVCILGNLAHSSPASQNRLVTAGVVTPMVALLASKHAPFVCHVADALANLVLNHHVAQRQLGTARCVFPGSTQPATVGKASAGNATTATHTGGVAALVRLLSSPNPLLVAKALRVLSNAVLGCAVNQNLLLATGIMPVVIQFASCEVAAVSRQAVGVLTNLLPGCEAAGKAALAAGLPATVAKLLTRTKSATAQQEAAAGSDSPAASSPSIEAQQPADNQQVPVYDELMDRSCLLAANLAAAGPSAKTALVDAGVLVHLLDLINHAMPLIQQAGASNNSSQPGQTVEAADGTTEAAASAAGQDDVAGQQRLQLRVVAAAAGALSNLVLHAHSIAEQAVQLGAIPVLLQVLQAHQQDVEAASRATHALGSLVLHSHANKAAARQEGMHLALMTLCKSKDVSDHVRMGSLRALGHWAMTSQPCQVTLVDQGIVEVLMELIQAQSFSLDVLSAALGALESVSQGCSAAQLQFLSIPDAAQTLTRQLGSPSTHVITLACACVHALCCPQDRLASQTLDSLPASGVVLVEAEAGSSVAAPRCQEELAKAGAVAQLVKLLGSRATQILDCSAMALCALVSGNRNTQKLTAAGGGVAALAGLLDRVDHRHPALTHHLVDTWLELGGAMACVKLLAHVQPLVVERACRRMASALVTLQGKQPTAIASKTASSPAVAASDVPTWLVGPITVPAASTKTQLDTAVAALVKAGAPAALLSVCQSRAEPRVLVSALVSLRGLVEVGGDAVRSSLTDAGAWQSLQALQQAAAAVAGSPGAKQHPLPSSIKHGMFGLVSKEVQPHAFNVGSPAGQQLASSPPPFLRQPARFQPPQSGKQLVHKAALTAATESGGAHQQDGVTGGKAAPRQPAAKTASINKLASPGSKPPTVPQQRPSSGPPAPRIGGPVNKVGLGTKPTSKNSITAWHVAALAEQVAQQLMP